ncbi:MAG: iron ABC transporter permease [Pseudomonadota bacterium]|nr:iron ABC transporter permease [Pseudomonadota bacterium]
MSPTPTASPAAWHRQPAAVWLGGGGLLLLAFTLGAAHGAYAIAPSELAAIVGQALRRALGLAAPAPDTAALVFTSIRLPRLLLGMAAGAGLGLAGALMQGLFRNPLADPGLVGVSSGAALAAGLIIVLGAALAPDLPRQLGSWALVAAAFAGGLGVTALIYLLAQTGGGTHVALMLLAGIAINALAGAGLGYLSTIGTDEQMRNLQFWLLGSLGGARWSAVLGVLTVCALALLLGLRLAQPLNAIALGEAQASALGVPVERVKRAAVVVAALVVGAVTATTGIIGFIGLVAPHMVRLLVGPDHRLVLPGAALLGAALVLGADALARTLVAPAELPLGVLTAALGAPFFLLLLRGQRRRLVAP